MKTRIIFDANSLVLPKSGVGYFTHEFVQSLAEVGSEDLQLTGYYFNFLGKKKPLDLPSGQNINYLSTKFFPTKILNVLRRIGIQVPLEFFVPQKADVVLFPNFVSMPTLRKPLRVLTVHDLGFVDHPEFVSAKNGAFLRKWVPRSLQHADIVITISQFSKRRLMQEYGVPEQKIHVVAIPPVKRAAADDKIIKKYKLSSGYLLFVGNIEPRKNIIGLLRAYENLPTELQNNFPLVLAGGKGWNDDEIVAQFELLKNKGLQIVQTGYVTDQEKAALYENATVCVLPSHYEGFGMPILEAMSYGKPVLCSDIPVFHEVADEAGLFFDQNNPKDIAAVISKVLGSSELRKKLSLASKHRIAAYKTWQDVAGDFIELINQKLADK